jgi:ionotropic glutamate receptor NMDA 1/ionotropic glutamate receptor
MGAFKQFVRVTFDQTQNATCVTGFTINVFEAVVKRLPYNLPYVLVPFYGTYDEMVEQVYRNVRLVFLLYSVLYMMSILLELTLCHG